MLFVRLINKILFLIGVKSYRWKLAICEFERKKVKILKIFKPGFFEFWADPFFIKYKKKNYIFFECYKYFSKRGEIHCLEIKKDKVVKKKIILKTNYHLSYPQIFKHNNKFYLIPESYQNNQTSVYVCLKFPYQWKKINTIFKNEKICDTTVLIKNKKIWLFLNKARKDLEEFNKKLYIYQAENISLDKLKPHKKNPVINSQIGARNAGSIILKNRNYFRPAQIYKKNSYGYGFSIFKIKKLNRNEFIQKELIRVTPRSFNNKNICGVHHYNKISEKKFLTDLCFRFSF